KKADAELRERLVKVERRGWKRPRPLTFAEYADTWFAEGEIRRRWRPRTVIQYRSISKRLKTFFGPYPLATIRPRHVAEYVAQQAAEYEPSTVGRDIDLLFDIFKSAKREELVEINPVDGAERPTLGRRKWRILAPAEVS